MISKDIFSKLFSIKIFKALQILFTIYLCVIFGICFTEFKYSTLYLQLLEKLSYFLLIILLFIVFFVTTLADITGDSENSKKRFVNKLTKFYPTYNDKDNDYTFYLDICNNILADYENRAQRISPCLLLTFILLMLACGSSAIFSFLGISTNESMLSFLPSQSLFILAGITILEAAKGIISRKTTEGLETVLMEKIDSLPDDE